MIRKDQVRDNFKRWCKKNRYKRRMQMMKWYYKNRLLIMALSKAPQSIEKDLADEYYEKKYGVSWS